MQRQLVSLMESDRRERGLCGPRLISSKRTRAAPQLISPWPFRLTPSLRADNRDVAAKVALPIFDLSISERSIFHFDAGLSKKAFK